MKVESDWTGTLLTPENKEEEKILQNLWNALPSSEARYDNLGAFHRKNKNDKTIFICSGE